jgi:predicted GTPase
MAKLDHSLTQTNSEPSKAGSRWTLTEDEQIKTRYQAFLDSKQGSFEKLLQGLVSDFGRSSGGIIARLAKFFPDVPGFDYAREAWRAQELAKAVQEHLPPEKQTQLISEYEKYVQQKKETYLQFLKRIKKSFQVTDARLIRYFFGHQFGSLVMYSRADLGKSRPVVKKLKPIETQVFDFSGNPEAQAALKLMEETRKNIFLTGEAGTGKSTLLSVFRAKSKKNLVVLAPTGVAALNVEGQTIHSFCGFGPDITVQKVKKVSTWSPKKKLLQNLDTIVIDEISMVRADLLDCVDKFLRLNGPKSSEPFGGVQMIFIGDLFQLPPVEKDFVAGQGLLQLYASPYFFDAKAYKDSSFEVVQLSQMYRQHDQVFVEILRAVRSNALASEHLTLLNQRTMAPEAGLVFEKFAVYLTPTNAKARQVNAFFLDKLASPLLTYTGLADKAIVYMLVPILVRTKLYFTVI